MPPIRPDLAVAGRQLQRCVNGPPDDLGLFPRAQRLLDRAAAEAVEHLCVSPDAGVAVAEMVVEPLPELAVAHATARQAAETVSERATPGVPGAMLETEASAVPSSIAKRVLTSSSTW